MARKSLQDLSGIAKTIAGSSPTPKERSARSGAPALGALQGALNAIRDLDPNLIDDWGPSDRMDAFTAVNTGDENDGFEALKRSIAEGGQHVPILVRRAQTQGRFEIIYGRRRLKACRDLGLKVKANVQDLDDATALLAKGLENAARRNLSFYEKARFAADIQAAGHGTTTVRQALGLSASGLSHLTKVTDCIPRDIGTAIGPAPKSGRPKWTALADAFAAKKITSQAARSILTKLAADVGSDDRLDYLLNEISRRGARAGEGREVQPIDGVRIKSGKGSITLSVKRSGQISAFADWLDENLEDMIKQSYAAFTAVNTPDDT